MATWTKVSTFAGPKGDLGPVGPAGAEGPAGPAGPTGLHGPEGPVGPVGPAGPEGPAGPIGPEGVPGDQGPVGPQGPIGVDGADGAAGPAGANGRSVVTAALNASGELLLTFNDGDEANVGVVRGLKGDPGTSIEVRGTVPLAANLPVAGAADGDGWVAQDDGHLYIYDNTTDQWVDAGQVVGPPGPQGPVGDPGPRGTFWYTGNGLPPATAPNGSRAGDLYLDMSTGTVYELVS